MKYVTKSHGVPIFDIEDVKTLPKIVQLTKWLHMNEEELLFLTREYKRINDDKSRTCAIAYSNGNVALFVDDLTNGAFDGNENK